MQVVLCNGRNLCWSKKAERALCCVCAEFRTTSDRYSRLLGLRSFGQAWQWFKESRRANCVALHSFLTFIMLPWHRIVAGMFVAISVLPTQCNIIMALATARVAR